MHPKVTDNDKDEITVSLDGRELRGWSYANDGERRQKMLQAHEYVEGWCQAAARLKASLDTRLNDCLCEMKPDYDDSIVGFNEAWDIVRKVFEGAESTAFAAVLDSVRAAHE
jgi:hypothetical protein